MARIYQNFLGGELDAALLTAGLTMSSPALASVNTIASPDYMVMVLDPDGIGGAPEIIHLTAITAGGTTGTVLRGQEGTVARDHVAGTEWVGAPVTAGVLNDTGSGIPVQTTAPVAPEDGDLWLDTDETDVNGTPRTWVAYTPTWTADGTAPVLGNGTLTGQYLWLPEMGLIHWAMVLTWGSTTTGGTNGWHFGNPPGRTVQNDGWNATITMYDTSLTQTWSGTSTINGTQTNVMSAASSQSFITATTPFTWAAGDYMHLSATARAV